MRARLLAATLACLPVVLILTPEPTSGQDTPVSPAAGSAAKDVLPFGPALLLPADSGVSKKFQAVRDYVASKEWDQAARLLQGLLDMPEDVFVPVTRRGLEGKEITTGVSLRAETDRLLAALPRPGLEAYDAFVGKRASQALADARAQPAALAVIVQRYAHTKAGADAAALLGAHHLDRGHFDLAAAHFGHLLRSPGGDKVQPLTLFQAAVAFRRTGDRDRAEQTWKRLAAAAPDGIKAGDRTIPLDDLEKQLHGPAEPDAESAARGILAEERFRLRAVSEGPAAAWLADAARRLEANSQAVLPAGTPLVVGNRVFFRGDRGICAIDLATGLSVWESPSALALGNLIRDPAAHAHVGSWVESYLADSPAVLLENTVLGSLSGDGRRVYAVEDLPIPPRPVNYPAFHNNQGQGLVLADAPGLTEAVYHSKLLALDAESGKVVWELGGPGRPAHDGYFLGPPLPLGGKLYVPVQQGFDLRLFCLEPLTGEVVWTQTLATYKSRLPVDGGRRLHAIRLVYGDGLLVCPTYAGAVVAFDVVRRSFAWAHAYRDEPSPPEPLPFGGRRRPRFQFVTAPPNITSEWKVSAPVIAAGRVVFAAPDASELRCLDLHDGSLVWQGKRSDGDLFLAGAADDKVIVVGKKEVRALNLADGTALWQCDTSAPGGRGAIARGVFHLPVRWANGVKELLAIDLAKGTGTSRTALTETEAVEMLPLPDGLAEGPGPGDRIGRLVGQLGSDHHAEREAATQALDAAGASALGALRKAAGGGDPEARRRAAALVAAIERRLEMTKVMSPQRLRLQYKDTPLADAAADFSKKSGVTLKLGPELVKAGERKITLDTGAVTFWEAFDQFCARGGLVETMPPASAYQPRGTSGGSSISIMGGRGTSQTNILRSASDDKPLELTLGDGKPVLGPTSGSGALRVRLAPADTPIPHHTREAGEVLFGLDVAADGGLRWQKAVGLRIDRALDEDGRLLRQLPTTFRPPAPAGGGRGSVVVNGTAITAPPDEPDGPAARLVAVRLKQPGEKPARHLKELTGTITAQVRTPEEAVVVVEKVLHSGGQTVKGKHGGEIKVVEVVKDEDGRVRLKVQVEALGRGITEVPANPFGGTIIINGKRVGEEDLLSSLNFALLDEKGNPLRTVKAMSTGLRAGAAHEYELVYEADDGQTEAAKFVYTDRRTLFIDVPFTLRDVPLP
ncbi:MAG TPA: PQQ-binding-like beta-propeller repeat protein [Gemmataceae bacterium]|nr:PQQ-binding-like beta-propeller repeat protein [Gemmataceae bacterium]